MNVIAATDLYFPGHQDPVGRDYGGTRPGCDRGSWDRLRYVAWVDAGRPHADHNVTVGGRGGGGTGRSLPELAPRLALHVACRNGARS